MTRSYTIGVDTYYVVDDRIYVRTGELHDYTEVDIGGPHLVDGEVRTLDWGGEVFDQVAVYRLGSDSSMPPTYIPIKDFEPVPELRPLVPEGINECPNCGSWAGPTDKEPYCITCGYNIGDDDD